MSLVCSLWGQGHPTMTHYFYLMLEECFNPYTPPFNGPEQDQSLILKWSLPVPKLFGVRYNRADT